MNILQIIAIFFLIFQTRLTTNTYSYFYFRYPEVLYNITRPYSRKFHNLKSLFHMLLSALDSIYQLDFQARLKSITFLLSFVRFAATPTYTTNRHSPTNEEVTATRSFFPYYPPNNHQAAHYTGYSR